MMLKKYKFFLFLFLAIEKSFLFGSQPIKTETAILKSLLNLKHWIEETYQLQNSTYVSNHKQISSEDEKLALESGKDNRQLVLRLGKNEKKIQSLTCWRIYSDTLLLFSAKTTHDERITVVSCYHQSNFAEQLGKIQAVFKNRQLTDMKTVVLHCQDDRGVTFLDEVFLSDYKKNLGEIVGVEPQMIGYSMIPGNSHRDKDHFICHVDQEGVTWLSAHDNFQKHTL